MIEAAPLLTPLYSPRFLFNILLPPTSASMDAAMQQLLAQFALRESATIAEEIRVSSGADDGTQRKKHLPRILHCDKRSIWQHASALLHTREKQLDEQMDTDLWAEDLPVLLGNEWVADSGLVNFEVKPEEIYSISRNEQGMADLQELIEFNLYFHAVTKSDGKKITVFLNDDDDSEQTKRIESQLDGVLADAWSAWDSWWREKSITLLSPQILNLAAWFSILVSSDVIDDIRKGNNSLINMLQSSIIKMNSELEQHLDALRVMLRKIMEDYGSYTNAAPSGESAVKQLKAPFLRDFKNERGQMKENIVFTPELFSATVHEWLPNEDPDKLIELAKRKRLLNGNRRDNGDPEPTRTVKLGKKDNKSGEDYQKRCYAFAVEEVKKYLI